MSKDVFDLLIIFTDDTEKVVHDVTGYALRSADGCFIYDKNDFRNFLPVNNIKYFGRKDNWEG